MLAAAYRKVRCMVQRIEHIATSRIADLLRVSRRRPRPAAQQFRGITNYFVTVIVAFAQELAAFPHGAAHYACARE